MFNKSLSDIILENLTFLKVKKEFFSEQKNVLRYFLHKDIETILGKDQFSFDFNDSQKSEIEIDKVFVENKNVILIHYLGELYQVYVENENLVIAHNGEKMAQISQIGKLQNMFIDPSIKERTIETQNIYLYPEKIFEYEKRQYTNEGQIVYPKIRLKEMGSKYKDYDYFTVSYDDFVHEEKTFFQKIFPFFTTGNIIKVQTSYKAEDTLNYVENIFMMMELEFNKNIGFSRKK